MDKQSLLTQLWMVASPIIIAGGSLAVTWLKLTNRRLEARLTALEQAQLPAPRKRPTTKTGKAKPRKKKPAAE